MLRLHLSGHLLASLQIMTIKLPVPSSLATAQRHQLSFSGHDNTITTSDGNRSLALFQPVMARSPILGNTIDPPENYVLSKAKDMSTMDKGKGATPKVYSFRKKKPLPGAYPRNFSPYTLANTSTTTAVNLSHKETKNDLFTIQQNLTLEFQSQYFDEDAGQTSHERPVKNITTQLLAPTKINQRIARRNISRSLQAPITEAEERRQIRAAMKASRLESTQSSEPTFFMASNTGNSPKEWDQASMSRNQKSDEQFHVLWQVCSEQILRTG